MSITSQASQRITALLDDNSFVEIGAMVTARATDFNLKQTETPSDGCITGYGVIDGNLVYVYGQDASVLGGSIGEMHAKKIAGLYDLAMKTGAPVIGLIDSAGLRLQEATDALNAFGEIYKKQTMASGVIPQITAVFGTCGGGLALFPGADRLYFYGRKEGQAVCKHPPMHLQAMKFPNVIPPALLSRAKKRVSLTLLVMRQLFSDRSEIWYVCFLPTMKMTILS